MTYVAPSTVTTLQTYTSAAHNVIVNDVIDHETRIVANRLAQVNVASTFVNDITFSTTSTSFVDLTGLSVSITPSSASSKVLLFWTLQGHMVDSVWHVNIVRASTSIGVSNDGSSGNASMYTTNTTAGNKFSGHFLDSPATTSATTYKLQVRVAGGTFRLNRRVADTSYQGTTAITVMEILV
jgi:hypothetical protein